MPTRSPLVAPIVGTVGVALALTLMWWLSGVFVPLGLGLLVAFLVAPAVERLQRLVRSRSLAAAVILMGAFAAAAIGVTASIPVLVGEARHLRHAITGETVRGIRLGTETIDYRDWADPDGIGWDKAALLTQAKDRQAPKEVLLLLGALPAPDKDDPEQTLADALGDLDGDGRIDPGYVKRIRVWAGDRSSWLGNAWHSLDRSGVVREAERAWRKSMSRDQIRKVLSGSETLSTAGDYGWRLLESLGDLFSTAFSVGLGMVLVPVYAFFFLSAMPRWRNRLPEYLPLRHREKGLRILRKILRVIAGFVRGRLVVCSIVGLVTAIGWAAMDVRAGFLFGLLVGLLTVIPFANVLAFVPVVLVALLDFGAGLHGVGWLVGVVAVYVLGQVLESVLNPIIVGDAVQIDVVTLIVALLIGGSLAGFFGLLVAVPVAATLRILADELALPAWRAWAADGAVAVEVTPDAAPAEHLPESPEGPSA
ncbi:MAG: AI-2E family transporter [Myxococcota bacterium]